MRRPRSWWKTPSNVKVAINGQSVCVRSLGAGAWSARAGAAPKPGTVEDHGAFALANDGKSPAEFLVLLDVGCKRPAGQHRHQRRRAHRHRRQASRLR